MSTKKLVLRGARGLLLAGLVGATLPACSRPSNAGGPAPVAAATSVDALTYRDHGGSSARVERRIDTVGHEVLHGRTRIVDGARTTEVVEDATFDAAGSLVRASVSVSGRRGDAAAASVVFERARGEVRGDGRDGPWTFDVPADAPWAYAPLADAEGRAPATPIAAWVAFRAARAASVVRVVNVVHRTSYRAPVAQLAITTELGTTVVLGDDGIDVSDGFVREVRLTDLGVRLARAAEPREGPGLAWDAPFAEPGTSSF